MGNMIKTRKVYTPNRFLAALIAATLALTLCVQFMPTFGASGVTLEDLETITIIDNTYYTITNADELFALSEYYGVETNTVGPDTSKQSYNFILMNDIDLTGDDRLWVPICTNDYSGYMGIFDGNGKKITGLKMHLSSKINDNQPVQAGFFGKISGSAEVRDLVLSDIDYIIEGDADVLTVGGIAGNVINSSITGCSVDGSIYALSKENPSYYTYLYTGGIAGKINEYSEISSCSAAVSIETTLNNPVSEDGVCGSVADYEDNVKCVNNQGNVNITTLINSGNALEKLSNISFSEYYLDMNYKLIIDLDMEENEFIPIGKDAFTELGTGFTGTFDGNYHVIKNLGYIGNISSVEDFEPNIGLFSCIETGGEVINLGLIDCQFVGKENVGGIAGINNGSIINCFNSGGFIFSYNGNAGGIFGYADVNKGQAKNCFNTGYVANQTSIEISEYDGTDWNNVTLITELSTSSKNYGGIAGIAAQIINCYNTGTITGGSFVGGVVGKGGNTVVNCYNTGYVNATDKNGAKYGPITGKSSSPIVGGYYLDEEIDNGANLDNCKGITREEMTAGETFADCSMATLGEGYDKLTSQLNDDFCMESYSPHLISSENFFDDLCSSDAIFTMGLLINSDGVSLREEPVFITKRLPNGVKDSPYEYKVSAKGDGEVTYIVSDDYPLPEWLTLGSDGTLSGTPTEIGGFDVMIIAKDENDGYGAKTFKLVIGDEPVKPQIFTTVLPDGIYGEEYDEYIEANTAVIFSLSDECVERLNEWGLDIDESGHITGIPNEPGKHILEVTAQNEAGDKITQNIVLTVRMKALSPTIILPADEDNKVVIPGGVVGDYYDYLIPASGSAVIKFSYHGILPQGLYLDSSGMIIGTPEETGDFEIEVTAWNKIADKVLKDTRILKLSVTDDAVAPTILNNILIEATETKSYQTVLISSGSYPIEYTVNDDLPEGVSITGDGTITGVPLVAGDYTFSVTAANKEGSDTKDITLSVKEKEVFDAPPIDELTGTQPVSFRIDADYKDFMQITLNGNKLKLGRDEGFTAEEGSTVITVMTKTLSSLKNDNHKLVAYFDGGIYENTLAVNIADNPNDPKNTDPPGTDPPGTDPPGTDPPGTDPPGTDPPGTDPPGTDPPGTDPPGTDPPGTDPPGTDPPDTNPPDTNPPGTPSSNSEGTPSYNPGYSSSVTSLSIPADTYKETEQAVVTTIPESFTEPETVVPVSNYDLTSAVPESITSDGDYEPVIIIGEVTTNVSLSASTELTTTENATENTEASKSITTEDIQTEAAINANAEITQQTEAKGEDNDNKEDNKDNSSPIVPIVVTATSVVVVGGGAAVAVPRIRRLKIKKPK